MPILEEIIALVRQAGDMVRSARNVEAQTNEKTSAADLVTAYDVAVENFLKKALSGVLPEALFYGEEEAENGDPTCGWAFIVDPIDGTTNFVRDFHQSAISVALAKDGRIEYAVVYDPYQDEMFSAQRGKGAWRNGQAIHVSRRPLSEGLFLLDTSPYLPDYHAATMHLAEQLFQRSCDLRRFGAAALDLCYIACGRAEVCFEYSLCPWDYGAGSLIVTEAGGVVSTLEGKPLAFNKKCSVWASNAVNQQVREELEI